jgi:hypothetical protein
VTLKISIRGCEGELSERAEDVVRVLEGIAGRSLSKAETHDHVHDGPPDIEYPALTGALAESAKHADRIRRVMDQKIAAVLARVK